MSRKAKIWLLIATILVVVGCIIFGGAASKMETREHAISDTYENISITIDTADVIFVPTSGETKVVCFEQEKVTHSVCVENGTLTIKTVDARKWYEYIGIFLKQPTVTVYLPVQAFSALTVKGSTGDVTLPKEYSFETIDIAISTGDVLCEASTDSIKLRTSTGDITVKNATANAVDLQVSTGRTTLENLRCGELIAKGSTGDITLTDVVASGYFTIERSTGDVKFDGCDAAQIEVSTDTGNVTGSLLTEKVFIAKADTGNVSVPETTSGGKCKITTDTGNIKITIG